jgi:hypothetical protein
MVALAVVVAILLLAAQEHQGRVTMLEPKAQVVALVVEAAAAERVL